MNRRWSFTSALTIASVLLFAGVGEAQDPPCHTNGGFETGDFTDWATIGRTGVVDSGFGVDPTEGATQALLATGFVGSGARGLAVTEAELEVFLGLPPMTLEALIWANGGFTGAPHGSAMVTTLDVFADEVIEFDWNFLTDEPVPTPLDDYAFVTITCDGTLLLADTYSGMTTGAGGFARQTGYNTFSFTCPTDGTIEIGFGVVDAFGQQVASGLLIDNLTCGGAPNTPPECGLDLTQAINDFSTDEAGGFIVTEGQTIRVPFSATDENGDPLEVALLDLPAAAVLDFVETPDGITGSVSWTPTADDQVGAPYTGTLLFTDPDGAETSCSFVVGDINMNPVCDAGGGQYATMLLDATETDGAVAEMVATADDPDGDVLSMQWELSNPGATLADASQAMTSGFFPIGETMATFTVADGLGGESSSQVMVVVVEAVEGDTTAPEVTVELIRLRGWGQRYRVQVSAVDDSDPEPSVTAEIQVGDLEPIPVEDGQVIRFVCTRSKVKVKVWRGKLLIKAPELLLVATAVDAAGNEASGEALLDRDSKRKHKVRRWWRGCR